MNSDGNERIHVSPYYRGDHGTEYYKWQQESGLAGGVLIAPKFQEHIMPNDKVLDFGCGGGWVLKNINCGLRLGVEPNQAAHESCAQNGVTVFTDVSEIHEAVDVIISNHCLEHVPYPIHALTQLRLRLKENGKIVLIVPIDDWRNQKDFRKPDINNHLHTWTPLLLSNTLKEAGFNPIDVIIIRDIWPTRLDIFRYILPRSLFHLACITFSFLMNRRELMAVATIR